MFEFAHAPADEIARRRSLAAATAKALRAAGLPVLVVGSPEEHRAFTGATVEVDTGADGDGGVYADWSGSQDLVDRAVLAVGSGRYDDPAIRLSGAVDETMCVAMVAILTASGFTAEDPGDDLRPFTLRVVAGPSTPDA